MRTGALPAVASVLDAAAAILAEADVSSCHRLCCALSGGVDSVVLLDALASLRPRLNYALEAAHVHHGLNPAADEWQDFCVGFCERRNIPLHVFRVEVPRNYPGGLEEAARIARHDALFSVGCDWLVLGHHRDDQAETVLFRLLRGAGVRGAAAMAAIEPAQSIRRIGLLRPLLETGREGILAYARERNLCWVIDDSNADVCFARNDLRHRILPAIETRYPAARQTLARAASHFRKASILLDELAQIDAAAAACESVVGGEKAFDRASLLNLSLARLANLFRWELRRLGAKPPGTARLDETLRQLRSVPGPLCLPLGGCVCHSRRGRVWLVSEKQN